MEHKKRMQSPKSQVMYDPMIISRVKQYLEENVHQTYVDVGLMARLLQERYREYNRRKVAPFRHLVEQAYKTVLRSYGLDSNPSSDDNDDVSSDLEVMEERPDLMNNMMTNMYMDKQGTRPAAAQNDNELIDISSDDSDSETGSARKSSKTKSADSATIQPSVTIKKIAIPAAPPTNTPAGPAKEATTASTVKPANKNLEALAIGTVQASFSPLAKRRKIHEESKSEPQQNLAEYKSKPDQPVRNSRAELKQPSQLVGNENGATVNGSTPGPSKGLKKSKKEFAVRSSTLLFKDIGGLDKVLKELCELLLHIKHPEVYRFIGLPPPRGFLLHGPPGCGKTLLAQAIAGQLDVPLIQVAATELVAGVSGESEERIRELFEQAASIAPCVLFIDEIDAISSNRQNAQKDMERRIVAQLLSSLDGLSKFTNGDQVLIIGATNRPDALDPALRRVGRFDQEISLGIPDRAARESILKVLCHYLILERPFNFDSIASLTPGYVGADLLALATRAASLAVKRAFTSKERKLMIRHRRPIATVDLIEDSINAHQDLTEGTESTIDVDDVQMKPNHSDGIEVTEPTVSTANGDIEMTEPVDGSEKSDGKPEKAKSAETVKFVDTITATSLNTQEISAMEISGDKEVNEVTPTQENVESQKDKELIATEKESASININDDTDIDMKPVEEVITQIAENEISKSSNESNPQLVEEGTPKIVEEPNSKISDETTDKEKHTEDNTSPKLNDELTPKIANENLSEESIHKITEESTPIITEPNTPKLAEENVSNLTTVESSPQPTQETTPKPVNETTPTDDDTITEVVDLSDDDTFDDAISQLPLIDMLRWLSDHESVFSNEDLHHLCITMNDFMAAIKLVQPSAKREGFITVPDVTWDDIGSMRDIREELQLAVLAPVKYPLKLQSLGLHSPSGVLLCGPPGCGKTLLAKAVANEAGINFISVKGPELLNMYVGESERAVRQCFQRARNSAPCVIFFDEFDSLCPTRSGSSENTSSSRVVNQLLTEMDGVEDRKGVFLMAATNRPDIVDPAVLRPGRLDKILYVGLPGVKDRKEILEALTKKKPKLAKNVDIEELATLTENYTGADLAGLVRQASLQALKESIASSMSTDAADTSPSRSADHALSVNRDNFLKALAHIRPSVSEEDKRHYAKLQKKYMVTASTPQ